MEDDCCELVTKKSCVWALAKERIKHAQEAQKVQYDRYTKDPEHRFGERVMVHNPGEVRGSTWRLAQPNLRTYRVLCLIPSKAEVVLIDIPKEPTIFVALNCVQRCYEELRDTLCTGPRWRRRQRVHIKAKALPRPASQISSGLPREEKATSAYQGKGFTQTSQPGLFKAAKRGEGKECISRQRLHPDQPARSLQGCQESKDQ